MKSSGALFNYLWLNIAFYLFYKKALFLYYLFDPLYGNRYTIRPNKLFRERDKEENAFNTMQLIERASVSRCFIVFVPLLSSHENLRKVQPYYSEPQWILRARINYCNICEAIHQSIKRSHTKLLHVLDLS